jgi:hypothetical protein
MGCQGRRQVSDDLRSKQGCGADVLIVTPSDPERSPSAGRVAFKDAGGVEASEGEQYWYR